MKKQPYRYELKLEGTGSKKDISKIYKYNSAKPIGNVIEAMDDPQITFEGVVTIRRIKNT